MPRTGPRMSGPTIRVLDALLSTPQNERCGSDIARETQLASGTLYPLLNRLEQAGWLESRWEVDEAALLGRPRRRFYRLTAIGAREFAAKRAASRTASWWRPAWIG